MGNFNLNLSNIENKSEISEFYGALSSHFFAPYILHTKRKHAQKALISRKNLKKSSLSNENLTIKNNEIAFLGRKLKRSGHLNKIYTRDGTVHISSPEIHRRKTLKIYHINYLFNLFPYYDFGENYRENDQNDFLQSTY